MRETKRHIITGTSCSGKTSTCKELLGLGYVVMPEMARKLIREEQEKEHGDLPWNSKNAFQTKLFVRQEELEYRIRDVPEVILDRGLIDNLAYCRVYGADPHINFFNENLGCRNRYDLVFLLEPLPFRNDPERRETPAQAKQIHDEIIRAYHEFGYKPIHVPVSTPEERAMFIDQIIKQNKEG
jgi:predicted ATPase